MEPLQPLADPAPPTIPGFEIHSVLGRGSFGEVFLATQLALDRRVALKVLLHPEEPRIVARFQREAKIMGGLNHPNVVKVYDFGVHEDRPWLAMEYIEGGTLRPDRESGPPHPRQALELGVQVVRGIAYLHESGILHRDLKPGNLLRDPKDVVKIVDFGICRSELNQTHLTGTGMLMGTLLYLAPELFEGKAPHPGSDQFALSLCLWEVFSGTNLIHARSIRDASQQARLAQACRLHDLGVPWQDELDRILHRGLAPDPAGRYPTVTAMLDDMEGLERSLEARDLSMVPTRRISTATPAVPRTVAPVPLGRGRRPEPLVTLVTGLAAAVVWAVLAWRAVPTPEAPPPEPPRLASTAAAPSSAASAPPTSPSTILSLAKAASAPRRLRDSRLRTRLEQGLRDELVEKVIPWSGLGAADVEKLREEIKARWFARVIYVTPSDSSGAFPQLHHEGRTVSLDVLPGSGSDPAPLEIQLIPGELYRLVAHGLTFELRAPPVPTGIGYFTEAPGNFYAQAFSLGIPLEVVALGHADGAVLARKRTGSAPSDPTSLLVWPRGLPDESRVLVTAGPPGSPLPIYYQVVEVRLPTSTVYGRAIDSRILGPLEQMLAGKEDMSFTLTASASSLDLLANMTIDGPDVRSSPFAFGIMARQYPDARVLSRFEALLERRGTGKLNAQEVEQIASAAAMALGHIGGPRHLERIAAQLAERPTERQAVFRFWALALGNHPAARRQLPGYLAVLEGDRVTFRNWSRLWLWIDPASFLAEAGKARLEGKVRDDRMRQLLIEGVLWLGRADLLPLLAMLDPGRDPPERKAEAALMLALGQDPRCNAALASWGLRPAR